VFPLGRRQFARRGLLSAVVGGLACVLAAAPVLAFTSRSTHVVGASAPQTPVSSTAICPTGQHVLFGGFDVDPNNPTDLATGMRRTASDAWTVDAYNLGKIVLDAGLEPSPISVSAMAYCGLGPVPSKATRTVDLRYPSQVFGSATARCPAGTVVVAGGFASTPQSLLAVTGLERVVADEWRVSAYLPFAFGHSVVALTSIAYCGPGPAPKLESRTITAVNGRTARATCPVGTKLAFGGAVLPWGFEGVGYLKTLRAETRSTWSVGGNADSGKLTALAYCR
jgi:hypothetical protein